MKSIKLRTSLRFAAVAAVALFAGMSYAGGQAEKALQANAALAVTAAAGAQIRKLKADKADEIKSARAITDLAAKEARDLTAEEQTKFDGHMAKAASIDSQIKREEALAQAEAGMGSGGVAVREGADIVVEANVDPRGGFASMGEFARCVMQASRKGAAVDERLVIGAAAPGTPIVNETTGSDGGFAIPPEFSTAIWKLSLGEGSLIPLTDNTEIGGNSMVFPKDESTPWGGTGVQAYWAAEAKQAQQSNIALKPDFMQLHKLMALVPVTNEMLADSTGTGSYITNQSGEKIQWKANEAILFGDGIGKPLGALFNAGNPGSPAIVIPKEGGQAANTVDPKNITKMVERLLVGELGRAFWLATPDILTPLEAMTVGNYPIYIPGLSTANAPYGLLKGRPLQLSEHASALSSQGDISLISLKGYRTLTQAGGIQSATSMHLFFDADATAFRFTFRLNGKPLMSAPVQPPKSANLRSHFVTLGAR